MTEKSNARCPFPAGAKIVTYARDSGGDEQERSVDQQNEVYAAYCRQHGLILLHAFADRARPGSSTVGRDDFERMINHLHRNPDQVTGLLAWKLNRFARDLNDSQFYKADLRRRGLLLHFIADDLPNAGDATPILETILEWKAQRDRHDISVDAKRGLASLVNTRAADGSFEAFMPGTPPRCYKRQPVTIGRKRNGEPRVVSRWVPDPDLWERGRQAWALRAAGHSLGSIHKQTQLYKNKSCYSTFFANEIYKGELHYGGEILPAFVPPLCTPDEWAAVQALRQPHLSADPDNPTDPAAHPRRRGSRFVLSGRMVCATCGHLLQGKTSGRNKWRTYRCVHCPAPSIGAEAVEQTIIELLATKVLTAQGLQDLQTAVIAEQEGSGLEPRSATVKRKRLELAAVKRALSKLLDLAESDLVSPSLAERITQRERERLALETDLARLQSKSDQVARAAALTAEQLTALADRLRAELLSGDPERLRPVIRAYIVRIEAKKESGRVFYTLPLSALHVDHTSIASAPTGSALIVLQVPWRPHQVTRPTRKTERNAQIWTEHDIQKIPALELSHTYHVSRKRIYQIVYAERRRRAAASATPPASAPADLPPSPTRAAR